jgi:D-beta-D-heptose 7-phosphate kinase/D-beta-D-heptose 1-phosphate adenosyltransferase
LRSHFQECISQSQELIRQIECEWPRKHLLVLGDVMLDKYVWGEVKRISPEAPVPVVRIVQQNAQPGGAANVAMNLARLGSCVTLIGFTGEDENERILEAQLRLNGILYAFVPNENFPTITKTRIMGGRQQMLRLDNERLEPRPASDYARLLTKVCAGLLACDAVVLSDYAKGALPPDVCRTVISEVRSLRIPIVIDPKATDFSRYRGATTICPNLQELATACGLGATENPADLEALFHAGEQMVSEFDLEFLTATLSDRGIAVLRPGNRLLAPAVAQQVFDVSGAGDTVVSVLALCLTSGLPLEPSIQLANLAAGIVVGKVGTVPVEKHELLAALLSKTTQQVQEKAPSLPATMQL